MNRRLVAVLTAGIASASLSACASSSGSRSTGATGPSQRSIIPGPAGLIAGAPPTLTGDVWLLAGSSAAKTLHELDLSDREVGPAVPLNRSATSLSQSSSTLLGIGLGTQTTGTLEFLNGTTGGFVSAVAVGAPIRAVTVGADGSTFYVLNGTTTSESVTVVNSVTDTIFGTVPVPLDTVSIAIDASQQRIFALGSNGQMTIVAVFGGQVLSRFAIGDDPRVVVVSADDSTMYVLKGGTKPDDVAVFDLAQERQVRDLPAPADTMDIQVAPDDSTLYAFVGTPAFGNVQLIKTR